MFDRKFFLFFITLITIIGLSFLGFLFPSLNMFFFGALLCLTAYGTYRSLENGLIIAMTELMIGSQGYLFYLEIGSFKISLRIGIFIVVMLLWLYHVCKNRSIPLLSHPLRYLYYLAFGIFLFGILNAFFNGISFRDIFFDANGFIYWAYVFVTTHVVYTLEKDYERKIVFLKNIKTSIVASLSVIFFHTIFLLYLFSHTIMPFMRTVYVWTRDHRIGEIARPFLSSDFHRVFFQHQVMSVLAFVIFSFLLLTNIDLIKKISGKSIFGISVMTLTTVILSLSRSFWVALFTTFVMISIYLITLYRCAWRKYFYAATLLLAMLFFSFSCMTITVNFPIPYGKYISSADMLKDRLNFTSEAAVSSRWSLLPVLGGVVFEKPVFGHGFGKKVSYQTYDPRVRTEDNLEGWYSTYAFEWGYLDLLVKVGVVGTVIYLTLICMIWKRGLFFYKKSLSNYERNLTLGIFFAGICLLVIHMFTPYINHPLGIGFLLFVQSYFDLLDPSTIPLKEA